MQQNQERNTEKLMDDYLRENGLYRKKIAKDGSCLFRAVAEQVLHCQALHTRVRAECVKYLRQNRDQYESFIEGDFEEYLHMLQDPKSWVGQVEISALAVLYKHDFIIYRQPGEPPVNITEHGYSKTVLLCFLNGNHYDSVYPIPFIENASMCQSILYELLYDGVYGVDRNVLTPSLRTSKAKTEERESSEDSDLDEGEDFWCVTEQIQRRSSKATGRGAGVNNRTAYKGRGRGQARGLGRGCLLPKVRESLNPNVYRNVEYEMWLRSNRVQQKKDFCIAAGMHYRPGDKCQVRLNTGNCFYSAYIQEVSSDDGPVTVFIEELQERYTIPLWNLRTFSEDSKKVTEKRQTASSNNGPPERVTRPGTTPMRRSVQEAGVEKDEHAPLEILNKDEENFPTLEASAQAASVEGSRRAERKGSRKKVGADTKEQSPNLIRKAQRGKLAKSSVDQEQRVSPPPKEDPKSTTTLTKTTKDAASPTSAPARVPSQTAPASSTRPSDSFQTPTLKSITAPGPSTRPQNSTLIQSQTATASSPIPQDCLHSTPKQSQAVLSPSLKPVVDAQATRDPAVVTPVSPRFTLIQPQTFPLPSASVSSPVSSQSTQTNGLTVPVTTNPVLPQNSSETLQAHDSTASIVTPVPLDHVPKAPTAPITTTPLPTEKSVDDKYSPFTQNPARKPYISPNVSAPTAELCAPSAAPAPSSHPAESYLYEPAVSNVSAGAGGALVTDPLAQLWQDLLYPGFPQNDNKEHVQPPHFSYDCTGNDLPNDTSVLRFFFNLGLKAFTYQMFAPISYLGPLVQAYRHMQLQVPSPSVPWQPDNNSRPVITASNPSPAEGTPANHFELRGIIRTPAQMDIGAISHTSLPMRMPMPGAPHPTVYTGMYPVPSFGPPLQYLAHPTSHLSMPPPPPYATEIPVSTVAPIMEGAHEGQRSPQVEKTFWADQSQPPLVGADIKIGAVPVAMGMQHRSGAQAVPSEGVSGIRPEATILTNGNRQSKGGGFSGSSIENWETETAEFGDGDVKTGQSFQSQYKSGGRHGQDDRGGYRGHGSRGRREYTGWRRQDGQLPYHRGSGGRGRRRSYNNTRGTGYGNRQFTHAPES